MKLVGNRKGQTSTELMVITIAVLLLLLLVALLVIQKNFFTSLIWEVNENLIECEKVSTIIENFKTNPGYSETKIVPQNEMHIEKGSIFVGENSCHYLQSVKMQLSDTNTSDSDGFTLEKDTEYKIKKNIWGFFFCDAAETFC